MEHLRRIPLRTIINCRDLGGYRCADGSITQYGRLLRAAVPDTPAPEDMQVLKEYGIRSVLDLRGDYEVQQYPSAFAADAAFAYRQTSLYEINPATIAASRHLWDVYRVSVEEYRENYASALRCLLKMELPLLYHCFLGKDRTGILSALLLSHAGVAQEDILADYQVSATYLRPFYQGQATRENGLMWETNREHLDSNPETVKRLLTYFQTQYGGVAGYVKTLGLSVNEITDLGRLLK